MVRCRSGNGENAIFDDQVLFCNLHKTVRLSALIVYGAVKRTYSKLKYNALTAAECDVFRGCNCTWHLVIESYVILTRINIQHMHEIYRIIGLPAVSLIVSIAAL